MTKLLFLFYRCFHKRSLSLSIDVLIPFKNPRKDGSGFSGTSSTLFPYWNTIILSPGWISKAFRISRGITTWYFFDTIIDAIFLSIKKRIAKFYNIRPVITNTLLILIFLVPFAYADPADQGRLLGEQALERIGSIEKLKENVIAPMVSGDELPVQGGGPVTLNNHCPSSSSYLEVTVGSTVNGGDIANVHIRQDTNLDGVIDYSLYAPVPRISGVCADGVVSCNAGTWSGCSYHQWIADSTGRLTTVALPDNELKECYCVNNSCGSGVVNENLLRITNDLSSGVVTALHNANPSLAIADSSVTPGSAIYSATNNADDSCTSDYEFTSLHGDVTAAAPRIEKVKTDSNQFNITQSRMNQITSTTSASNGASSTTIYYTDDLGSHSASIANEETYGEFTSCEKACKVKRTINDTQASEVGHTALFRFSTLETDFALRKCENDICQTEPGDQIETDCSCLNEFNTVFSLLALLEGAARTVICSNGIKQ